MAKYIHIKANDGEDYMVEEVEATPVTTDEEETPVGEETHDEDNQLTPEEISALKGLAAAAPKLMALIQTTDSEEEEEEMQDEDEEETSTEDSEEEEEAVVDTDEEEPKPKAKDSFGSLAKKKKTKDSSKEARELEICQAWENRYKKSED